MRQVYLIPNIITAFGLSCGLFVIFKVNMEAGHGGKSGRFQRLRETAIEYHFILSSLATTR